LIFGIFIFFNYLYYIIIFIYFIDILDVLESSKPYKIDIKETKKVLLLRHADKEKKFEISFVSNGSVPIREFLIWKEKMEQVHFQ